MRQLIAFICILLLSVVTHSETVWPQKHKSWLLLGLELGVQEKTDVELPEIENSGFEFGGKGVYSRYSENWVWDLGLGFRFDRMKEDDVKVETDAFFGELGIRYRLNNNWSIGPELHLLAGQDVSFSDTGTNSDDKSSALFLGGRIFYDIHNEDEEDLARVGLQALTDMDLDERDVTYIQFVLEFGWPMKENKHSVTEEVVYEEIPEKEPALRLNLKEAGVRFDTGSSTLTGKARRVIQRLARALKRYEDEWSHVKIGGHTDITGKYKMNIELSRARAESVRRAFISNDISDRKISAQGFGPDRPLDRRKTKTAYRKNRRVELNLISDNASPEFIRVLKKILRKKRAR